MADPGGLWTHTKALASSVYLSLVHTMETHFVLEFRMFTCISMCDQLPKRVLLATLFPVRVDSMLSMYIQLYP